MATTEIKFTLTLPEVPEIHRLEAEKKAKEAYIMTLLRHGDISAGRAAELLEIERWQISDLMDIYQISPFPSQTKEELQEEVTQTLEILSQYNK
jgi:predicted HTH domain antitoxin